MPVEIAVGCGSMRANKREKYDSQLYEYRGSDAYQRQTMHVLPRIGLHVDRKSTGTQGTFHEAKRFET